MMEYFWYILASVLAGVGTAAVSILTAMPWRHFELVLPALKGARS